VTWVDFHTVFYTGSCMREVAGIMIPPPRWEAGHLEVQGSASPQGLATATRALVAEGLATTTRASVAATRVLARGT
jgi:hypothetical protein